MSGEQYQSGEKIEPEKSWVNNFSMMFATVNGSGSATANVTILRALFKMGIPVSGKNVFPSNIQGMPTWYEIRVSEQGFLGRCEKHQIVVAMNPATIQQDVASLAVGGVLFYSDEISLAFDRSDIFVYPMPINRLAKEAEVPPRLLGYIKNMIYVGFVAQMLGISMDKIRLALDLHFEGKQVAIDSNMKAILDSAQWAEKNLQKQDPFRVEPMNENVGCGLVDGNKAAALGAIFGGVQFAAWYPITPATGLAERLDEYLPIFRTQPETGKHTFAVVQAEDEISAIGMAIGAGWGGLRSMTATSGPGFSLMTEYLGLAYFSEIPVVVWDVQRMGPSTGLPTRTSQGDITFANSMGHGDKQYILLFPGSMSECFEYGWKAFDIAERIQSPVIVLSDLDLGMNQWITPEFVYPDEPMDRGKILWENDLEELLKEKNGDWGRYIDVDGDGIPYRTLVGNQHPRSGYFNRGTGHDEYARYSEDPVVWERVSRRIAKKFKTILPFLPQPVIQTMPDARFGVICVGSTEMAIREARHILQQKGYPTDYLRIRAKPFSEEVFDFIRLREYCYVVEANDAGQLRQLLTIENPQLGGRLRKVTKNDGLPISAEAIVKLIINQEEE